MASAIAVASPDMAPTAPTLHRLDNGLTIIAEQMPVEAVNLSLWFRAGSAVEADAINGVAHFLEHMIFKGTAHLPTGEFERRLESRGGVTNAATSQDYTQFFTTTAPQDFAELAPLQIELVMNPRLTAQEFVQERLVILEEIRRADDNPRRRMFYRAMEMAFDRLPYRRPVLGSVAAVEQLTAEQMQDFHRHWYQPERVTAVAVGNRPVAELVQVVAEGFEQAMARRSPAPHLRDQFAGASSAPEPPFAQIRRMEQREANLQQARLIMTWRVPGLAELTDLYALEVLAAVLGRGRTSRLVQDLREGQQLVTSVSASNLSYWRQGVFHVGAYLPAANLPAVEAAIAEHIDRICQHPISAAELSRVQTQVANRYIFGSESPSDRAGLYGYFHTLAGHLSYALDYPQKIQALTPEAIQRVAQRYLSPAAYGIVILRPEE